MQGKGNAFRLVGKYSPFSSLSLSLPNESSCLVCSWVDILNHSSNLYLFGPLISFRQLPNTDRSDSCQILIIKVLEGVLFIF